ncbi:helix-turn-helix domain-containing protein [Listeria seeligeri]|uniref:helix-turn-helix transcriptional regulator n=1 Tax=Listeria TaxID=1637 RepID=UPI00162A6718|nr:MULTISPECIES: helix-turn-helix transcriptional regulator [Listeria]EIY6893214.1 helix-turn-helix domain-containing protein [Listeria monocytogenes]MBC1581562.1 helix-turn-helix domain-containing protein [Listeria seeligeri]MBC1750446.1 helix-turn-helix domain-containing protein [Listeria seeligeri]MBC1880800.1 helix-turn-helix domain-containing protein [Listeria seeligeri]MBC6122836.1 helix-turn-helix domain-containing protein [Listeria seeligeri]
MKKKIGEALSEIRKIKGLTQNDIATENLTRSSITKIETNKMNPSYEKIMIFCKRMGVTLSEVIYYQKDRNVSEQEMLFYEFRNLKLSVYEDPLNELIKKMEEYLQREDDSMIFELRAILVGLKIFSETNDIELAKKEVDFIWKRLEKQDYWFEFDVLIIANIIYIFDLDTLIRVGEKILLEIDRNKYLINYNRLKIVLMFNIALFLKSYDRMDLVEKYLIRGIEYAYQNNDLISAYLGEYRFAEYKLFVGDIEEANNLYNKCVNFFEVIKDVDVLEDIKKDWKEYRGKLNLD